MTRLLTTLLLTLSLVFCATAQSPVADRDAVLARIAAAQKPQPGKSQTYAFTQTKHSPMLAQDAVSHGVLTLSGERQMRWQYRDPTDLALVVDGDSIYTVSAGVRKALSGAAGAATRGMAQTMMTLASGNALADEKLFAVELTEEPSAYRAVLTPKRRDMRRMMQQVIVTFDKKSYRVNTVRLMAKKDSYTLIEFRAK